MYQYVCVCVCVCVLYDIVFPINVDISNSKLFFHLLFFVIIITVVHIKFFKFI